ncbi:hypothetical protein GCM10027176_60140 [Actinoallomurus bryophytorum]
MIGQEEIFGPVLTILPYKDEDEAVQFGRLGIEEYLETKALLR